MSQPSLFQRNKTLLPVVLQRQTLANALAQHLKDLGLERRSKTIITTDEIRRRYELHDDDDKPGNGVDESNDTESSGDT